MNTEEQPTNGELAPFPVVYIKEEPQEVECSVDITVVKDESAEFGRKLVVEEDSGEEEEEEEEEEALTSPNKSDVLEEQARCPVCPREYSTMASLRAHLSKKHRMAAGPCFTCHLCGAVGQTRATLKRHLIRTHGQHSLLQHQLPRKCRHCGEGHESQAALDAHIAQAHVELLPQYHRCHSCPALFRSRHTMLRHFYRRHPEDDLPSFAQEQCQECHLAFPSRTALRQHLKSSHPEALVHKCPTCNATFKYSSLLRRHTKTVHEPRPQRPQEQWYKCCKCTRQYQNKARLEKHLTIVHLNPQQSRKLSCTLCSTTFRTNSHRARHYRIVHRDRTLPHCSECTRNFSTQEELNAHRQEHKMSCAVCHKTFLRRDSLREHLLIHSGVKLPCPYCPKKFTQNSNLKRHIRIHTGEKPYKCDYCNKRFGDKSACNSHTRVHTGAERCTCPLCGASFSKRQKLNYHMKKHTGEGLLNCPLCSRAATDSYSLKKHLEVHQPALAQVLQRAGVLGWAKDCYRLALHILHSLAWVIAQATQSHCPKNPAPEGEEGGGVPDHGGKNTKVERPMGEGGQPLHLQSSSEERRKSSLRHFRKAIKKMDILTDPLLNKHVDGDGMQKKYNLIKPEVLNDVLNGKHTQLNEAVRYALERCKVERVEAASREGRLETRSRKSKDARKTGEAELESVSRNKRQERAKKCLAVEENGEENSISETPETNNSEVQDSPQECASSLDEELLIVLAQLMQLIPESLVKQTDEARPSSWHQLVKQCLQKVLEAVGGTVKTGLDQNLGQEAEQKSHINVT